MKNDKAAMRRELRTKRRALSPEEQGLAAARLVHNLSQTRWFRVSKHIACYIANDGEINVNPVIALSWEMRKTAYLPVLSRIWHDRLWFAPVDPDIDMRPNRFGIPEPMVSPRELVRAQTLDLVLVPLVGFDLRGNRVGMGGGFYDRSLEFLRQRRRWRSRAFEAHLARCDRRRTVRPKSGQARRNCPPARSSQ